MEGPPKFGGDGDATQVAGGYEATPVFARDLVDEPKAEQGVQQCQEFRIGDDHGHGMPQQAAAPVALDNNFGTEAMHPATIAARQRMERRDALDEAEVAEREAMTMDRCGEAVAAVERYNIAAQRLGHAASLGSPDDLDRKALSRRAGQLMGRAVYLQSLGGESATDPIEDYIFDLPVAPIPSAPQRGDSEHSSPVAGDAHSVSGDSVASDGSKWKKRATSAATIAGAATVGLLHAPIAAVALAGGAAYATTRKDNVGAASRKVADGGLNVYRGVAAVDDRLEISTSLRSATSSSLTALNSFDKKHEVSKTVSKGAASAASQVDSATRSLVRWGSKKFS